MKSALSHHSGSFSRHPILTGISVAVATLAATLLLVELFLRFGLGLGDPLLYRSSPLFGYRLQENQHVSRRGIGIRVNNLGLRAEADWDTTRSGKILFLGNSVTFGGTFIANEDLFSHQAVRDLQGYIAGNGGVNGWGVENIHALVVEGGFLPASVYVTVLQDMDFERGLSKFAGQPFWSIRPACALEELLVLAGFQLLQKAKEEHDQSVPPAEREKAIENAVLKLKALDDFLKSRGMTHLIYLSTNTNELIEGTPPDSLVAKYLGMHGIDVARLADRQEVAILSPEAMRGLFYDWNHLNVDGHRLWGKMIGDDLKRILGEHRR